MLHPNHSRAPTYLSLYSSDVLVTAAYHGQFHKLGWYQCSLGHNSTKWHDVIAEYNNQESKSLDNQFWESSSIVAPWNDNKSLWHFRNTFIHGSTTEKAAAVILGRLQDQA
jgi:hypothetical protein